METSRKWGYAKRCWNPDRYRSSRQWIQTAVIRRFPSSSSRRLYKRRCEKRPCSHKRQGNRAAFTVVNVEEWRTKNTKIPILNRHISLFLSLSFSLKRIRSCENFFGRWKGVEEGGIQEWILLSRWIKYICCFFFFFVSMVPG